MSPDHWSQQLESLPEHADVDAVLRVLEQSETWSSRAARWRLEWAALCVEARPRIVLTGDVKAGRSSLLNAILGHELLRVSMRQATPVPVTVFADGWRLQEVPPGSSVAPGDGRVLVVDVRQPLPRRGRVVSDGDGPTVLVLTKLDRALEDAVCADDAEAEVEEAVAEAIRRATARSARSLAAVVRWNGGAGAEGPLEMWPEIQAALAPARQMAQARRQAHRAHWLREVAQGLHLAPEVWPPAESLDASARALTRSTLSAALSSVALDRIAWPAAVRPCSTHRELERHLVQVEGALMAVLQSALDRAMEAATTCWTSLTAGLLDEVDDRWRKHTGVVATVHRVKWERPACGMGGALESLARRFGASLQEAGGGLPGLVRLRRVEARKDAMLKAWDTAMREVEVELGAMLWDDVDRWKGALDDVRRRRVEQLEGEGMPALVAAARRRSVERWGLSEVRRRLARDRVPMSEVRPERRL